MRKTYGIPPMRIAKLFLISAFAFGGTAMADDLNAGGQLAERHDVVVGAEADLADAQSYLTQLEAGNFAGIFAVEHDGTMRCGELDANAACAPLTAADKAEAIAEARNMVASAVVELADAKSEVAGGGIEAASYAP